MEFAELNMNTKNLTKTTYEMINRQIITSLINRNGTRQGEIQYKQIFNFTYKDNASILTVGGMNDKDQKSQISKMIPNYRT